jgi:hypothetical protein
MLPEMARRTVLVRTAAALAALRTVSVEARRKKKKTKTAFRLVTGCPATKKPPCACNACEHHAANKLFAAKKAVVRAHRGCNCKVDSLDLPSAVWTALFRPPGLPPTQVVDKRDPRVQAILQHA